MQKAKMRMLAILAPILAVLYIVPKMAFADTQSEAASVANLGTAGIAGILGLMVGATANTIRGWWNAPPEEKYSVKKLLGSILLAIVQTPIAFGFANMISATGGMSPVIAFTTMFMQGFTVDVAHTATKN